LFVLSKYKAPSIKVFPSLSVEGSEDFAPRKVSSKVSKAASAAFLDDKADEALDEALLSELDAADAELLALVA